MSTDDRQSYQYGKRLAKKADKLFEQGRISHYDWRDLRWKALQMMRPRDCARLTGIR